MAEDSPLKRIGRAIYSYLSQHPHEMTYFQRGDLPPEKWRSGVRDFLVRFLNYNPPKVPLRPRILKKERRGNLVVEHIDFAACAAYRVPAYFLYPASAARPLPAVIALHDHGEMFLFGKEKLVSEPSEPQVVTDYRAKRYDGAAWAEKLAERGYAVLVPDALGWGERRFHIAEGEQSVADEETENAAAARCFDKCCTLAGTSWLGIIAFDDRRCIDYLQSRKGVDSRNIGCCGFCFGAYRAAYLAALDERVRCSCMAGWMMPLRSLLLTMDAKRSLPPCAPGLYRYLDHPDVISLAAPNAVFIQDCGRSGEVSESDAQGVRDYLVRIWEDQHARAKFQWKSYEAPLRFTAEMQNDAFAFLDLHLKQPRAPMLPP